MTPRTALSTSVFALTLGSLMTAPVFAQDNTLRVRLNADIRSTDPGVNRDGNTDMIAYHLFEGLVAYGDDTGVVPMLAEEIDVSDDGLEYTFRLREGVRFHNGQELMAEDVVFAWERFLDPETNWRCLPDFDGRGVSEVTGVEAVDDLAVRFTLAEPAALFLTSMARVDCGVSGIWHRDSLGADGEWSEPIGTGPYRLAEWRQGQFVELERFAEYAANTGGLDGLAGNKGDGPERVRFVLIPDSSATRAALQSGDIDLVADMDDRDAEELAARDGVTLRSAPTLGVSGLLLQTRDPVLSDVRIRRAIAHALDLEAMVEALGGDWVTYNPSPIPQISRFHGDVQSQGYDHDPEAARALLEEAGYDGEEIVIVTNQRYRSMYDMAVLSQAMLEAVGINARFEVMDWATQLDRYVDGNYMMQAFSFSARYDAGLSFDMFTGNKDEEPRKVWENSEALELIREVLATLDADERQPIFDRLHELMIEDVPAIWLYNPAALAVHGPRVAEYEPWGTTAPRIWAVRMN
jgi:peptide/nickel transport system substrate-binding protein